MSELLGKETIDLYNTSETRSNQKSFGLNYQKTGKQLMTEDEIAVMDGGKCILQIRGARPFFSDKYDITKHKNYRLLADENEKNRYKVEKELNPQLDLCQYFEHKKLKGYADFFNSSSSFCCGVI